MTSEFDYPQVGVVTNHWPQRARANTKPRINEKYLVFGLLGAGLAALAVWVRVMIEVVNDIALAGAAYFGS